MTRQTQQPIDSEPFEHPPHLNPEGYIDTGIPADGRMVARVNRWPLTALVYDPLWRGRSSGILTGRRYGTVREREAMTQWLVTAPGQRILDVGCGSGFYLRALHAAQPDSLLHGVDNSPSFLRVGARRLAADQIPVTLTLASAERLPYRDAQFDGIAIGGTPNELEHPQAAFHEIARILKPGGRLYFMAVMQSASWWGHLMQRLMRPTGLNTPDAGTWMDEIEAAGLEIVRAEHRAPLLVVTARKPA